MPDHADQEYWIREGFRDEYLKRWVVDLIYSDGGPGMDYRYAVYLDEDLSIQWFFMDQTPNKDLKRERFFPRDFGLVLTDVVHLETLSEGLRNKSEGWWSRLSEKLRKHLLPAEAEGAVRQVEPEERDFAALRRDQSTLRATRRLIAEALARGIEDYPAFATGQAQDIPLTDPRSDAARSALQKAQEYLKSRSSDRGRKNVLFGATIALAICLCLLAFFHYAYVQTTAGDPPPPQIENELNVGPPTAETLADYELSLKKKIAWGWLSREGKDVVLFSLMGSLGAMLSLLMGAASRQYDAGAGNGINRIEGASRVMVGVLGACFITLGIKSRVLLGFMTLSPESQADEATLWLHCLLGFAAGLSERLVPSFVSIVESQVQTAPKAG